MFMFARGIVNHGTLMCTYSWYDKHGTVMVLIPKYMVRNKMLDPTLFALNFNVFKPIYKIKHITYCFQCSFSHC